MNWFSCHLFIFSPFLTTSCCKLRSRKPNTIIPNFGKDLIEATAGPIQVLVRLCRRSMIPPEFCPPETIWPSNKSKFNFKSTCNTDTWQHVGNFLSLNQNAISKLRHGQSWSMHVGTSFQRCPCKLQRASGLSSHAENLANEKNPVFKLGATHLPLPDRYSPTSGFR